VKNTPSTANIYAGHTIKILLVQFYDTTHKDVGNVIFAGAKNDRPSLGIPLKYCSCNFKIPPIPGHKKAESMIRLFLLKQSLVSD
jgi:hypothetical protein